MCAFPWASPSNWAGGNEIQLASVDLSGLARTKVRIRHIETVPGAKRRKLEAGGVMVELSCQCVDGLVQDCGNSSALALELPQSCTKPPICVLFLRDMFHS